MPEVRWCVGTPSRTAAAEGRGAGKFDAAALPVGRPLPAGRDLGGDEDEGTALREEEEEEEEEALELEELAEEREEGNVSRWLGKDDDEFEYDDFAPPLPSAFSSPSRSALLRSSSLLLSVAMLSLTTCSVAAAPSLCATCRPSSTLSCGMLWQTIAR